MTLFNFLYNTLGKRANDPNNSRYFLPKVLTQINNPNGPGTLLPLKQTDWSIGAIKGASGAFIATNIADKKGIFEGVANIPDPDNPHPVFAFPKATVFGLQNIVSLPNPQVSSGSAGYTAKITIQLNQYDNFPDLRIEGDYKITQSLCASSDGEVCDENSKETMIGTGGFIAFIEDAFFDVFLRIDVLGRGSGRRIQLTVNKVNLRGALPGTLPSLVDSEEKPMTITISNQMSEEDAWLKDILPDMAKSAIFAPEGQSGLFGNLNVGLNEPANLAELSKTLSTQTNTMLDDMMGSIPRGTLPSGGTQQVSNPADTYVFDRLRASFNTPNSNYYLPKTVTQLDNPTLEPLKIAKIDLPDQTISGLKFVDIELQNIVFRGFGNLVAPPNQLFFESDLELNATIDIGTLNPPPNVPGKMIPAPPIKGTGQFTMLPERFGRAITGRFTVFINSGQLALTLFVTGSDASDMVIKVSKTKLIVPTNKMSIDLNIQSAFKAIINKIINKPNVEQSIIKQINRELSKNLNAISKQVTKATRQGIAAKLDS